MVLCFRACDRRYPFLWATSAQPPARWHGAGEGPCHYLATTPKGAWAEVVRHEGISDADDLADLELALWVVEAPRPVATPTLESATLTGDASSYPACRAEARRLRASGASGLIAPSAAVLSGVAERYSVDVGGQYVTGTVVTETVVLFGSPTGLVGVPAGEGCPAPGILSDVRPL